jgi:hypothetical protein
MCTWKTKCLKTDTVYNIFSLFFETRNLNTESLCTNFFSSYCWNYFHDPFSISIFRIFFSIALYTVPVIIFQIFKELYFATYLSRKKWDSWFTCVVGSGLNSNTCERWVTKDFQNEIHMQDINQGVCAPMNSTVTGHTPRTDHTIADWITHITTLLIRY